QTRELFSRLHPGLWIAVGQSPKGFLKRVDEARLLEAAEDPLFLNNFNRVLSEYDTYHAELARAEPDGEIGASDLVAYFCAEFGFHESLPIYSGGLGILAGDHCKAASDRRLPFVAVGLLYRQGYFFQTIDSEGHQHATYVDSDFDDLPIRLVERDGAEVRLSVELDGRDIAVRLWEVRIGHVALLLLDTDIAENTASDRAICHRLYGGDRSTRIEQEIVLGVGGARALEALGLRPTIYHINEGHAAFLVLERMRALIARGLEFEAALEAVAANTVFTTHTPVPAGHDHFAMQSVRAYFGRFCQSVGLAEEQLLALGATTGREDFNMTALAVRGSRFQNGVSRVHGEVASKMLAEFWPQVPPEENPVRHITNGVHIPTFLRPEWSDVFDRFLDFGWSQSAVDRVMWDRIEALPDYIFWSVHQYLKSRMLRLVRDRIRRQLARNKGSEAHLDRLLRLADPDDPNVLTIGFGRRFATYKRATLLLENLQLLREIVCDRERPVLFLFAGKAHPADQPGQELIRQLTRIAALPEFEGRILLVEGYDLRLARRLVSGVDVWLNNPVYPLEASGTSGMKAGMNGVINLSVLYGCWAEGNEGDNGWAIKPATDYTDEAKRNHDEVRTLYEILQDHVVPAYYARGKFGYSPQWVRMAKRSMASILPRFNSARMLSEYVSMFYGPAARQGRRFADDGYRGARTVAAWKARVREHWPGVNAHRVDPPPKQIDFGAALRIEVAVALNGLGADDVCVELLIRRASGPEARHRLVADGTPTEAGEQRFKVELRPELCGRLAYRIRVYPDHALLTHAVELGLLGWV
ncbi:MAG: alpha-glucan family phosphorylase, partial [Burkholderiales bacterium]